jgi:hypothetical protein
MKRREFMREQERPLIGATPHRIQSRLENVIHQFLVFKLRT